MDELLEKAKVTFDRVKKGLEERKDKRRSGWWDEECREMRSALKEGGGGLIEKAGYRESKKEYEKLIKGKKEKEKERYTEWVEKAVRERREWEVINIERERKEKG